MSEVFRDVVEKLKLRHVVDQSAITMPPGSGGGDLPIVFENIQRRENQESLTNLTGREAGLCALLGAISDVGASEDPDDLDFFVDSFLYHFYASRASVKGWRGKSIERICTGDVNYDRKLNFARLKKQEKEDFV